MKNPISHKYKPSTPLKPLYIQTCPFKVLFEQPATIFFELYNACKFEKIHPFVQQTSESCPITDYFADGLKCERF